ncbi:hypothetical protein OCV73_05945 [Barnesiella propionica]|uniref:gliding motility lipoprotein GldD n=1 Tax=Barnesiella propionica TaxID=2981781 RepID=UPI0011CBCCF7|nr:gliding motility lipoprotein GldD [Barnesiella propionica]MCU6768489.1 hypothetical protein [Barnesiella propionica]
MNTKRRKHYNWFSGIFLLLIVLLLLLISPGCRQDYSPKPDSYFRIDAYPDSFQIIPAGFPLSFEVQNQTIISGTDSINQTGVKWINITYPRYQATIYCSFHPVLGKQSLSHLLEESKELVYRHSVRAEAIKAGQYEDNENHIYATLYELSGESATPLQFVVTDSTHYMFRGALYFNHKVRSDSVAPVLGYISKDITRLIETIQYRP